MRKVIHLAILEIAKSFIIVFWHLDTLLSLLMLYVLLCFLIDNKSFLSRNYSSFRLLFLCLMKLTFW